MIFNENCQYPSSLLRFLLFAPPTAILKKKKFEKKLFFLTQLFFSLETSAAQFGGPEENYVLKANLSNFNFVVTEKKKFKEKFFIYRSICLSISEKIQARKLLLNFPTKCCFDGLVASIIKLRCNAETMVIVLLSPYFSNEYSVTAHLSD